MVNPTPVLIVGDAPSAPTGLGRILADVATRAAESLTDVCRIATLGYGGSGSQKLNFFQYNIEGMTEDFVIPNLPEVWEDFAGNEPGVILMIWDATRLGWFSRPDVMCDIPLLKLFLAKAKFQRWIYTPLDAEGPNGKLTYPLVQNLLGFNRILTYGEWAEGVVRDALGDDVSRAKDLDSISHGIDSKVFYPRDRSASRLNFMKLTNAGNIFNKSQKPIANDDILIGTVATNQERKDWGLWTRSCAIFLERHPKARFWIHVDKLERRWSIPALLMDFGLVDKTMISLGHITDDTMAQAYSACDLTLGIGIGEGFGYPLAESLACGTPVVHVNYAGGAEVIKRSDLLVEPAIFHLEGLFSFMRPVIRPERFAKKMTSALRQHASLDPKFYWENLWPRWEQWLRRGLKSDQIAPHPSTHLVKETQSGQMPS